MPMNIGIPHEQSELGHRDNFLTIPMKIGIQETYIGTNPDRIGMVVWGLVNDETFEL